MTILLAAARAPLRGACLLPLLLAAVEAQAPAGPGGVLELVSGERIAGRLDPAATHDGLRWITPVFATPLVFPPTALSLASFDPDPATHAAQGAWRATLVTGDVVFGDLQQIDAATVTLATARHGTLGIARTALAALQRRVGGDAVYVGPNNVLEWQRRGAAPEGAWRAEGGSLVAAKAGAEIWQDGLLAEDCRVDCELSWSGGPGFRCVLLAAADAGQDAGAVVLETWDDLLVAWHERADGVDLLPLPVQVRDQGRAALAFRRQAGQLVFTDPSGQELGRLPATGAGSGFALRQLYDGGLRLDRLCIERLHAPGAPAPRTLAGDEVRGYVAATATFELAAGGVDAAAVDTVRFAAPAATPAGGAASDGTEVLLQDGTRLSGAFTGVADGHLHVQVPWSARPVVTTVDALKALRVGGNTRPRQQQQCRLQVKDDRFLGRIVGWSAADGALQWQPTLAASPSLLRTRDDLRFELARSSAWFAAPKTYPHRILFTNRDCLPCRIEAITADTVTFVEPFHGARREVASVWVKALEFEPRGIARIAEDARVTPKEKDANARRVALREARKQRERNFVDAQRRETILAVPRKYKGRPPTHLVLAGNGDVLRGVLAAVTADAVQFEMSLSSNASVPRAAMAAMVLFHEAADEDPAPFQGNATDLVLEVALDQETRVTIGVTGADAKGITGVSPFVGTVTLPYEDVTTMVTGGLRGKAAGFFTAWKLTPMKEPPY